MNWPLFFVQESLKERPNWLLIFDNVENFKYIQQYFPYSVKAWGKGKIIITTRDSNIINNHHITNNNVVQMTELSEEEKLELFTSIIDNSSLNHELEKNRVALLNFLENIPSFPLDIITAAHYIKETGVTYDKYIELINNLDQNLAITQEHMLKEIGQYSETRYGIITLSLKHIMDKNPAFQDLLLFISLIDPHNIPVDLLNTYKDFSTVNDFLIELKRLSFITNNKVTDHNKIFTFSIHHSTQSIILKYLVNSLNLNQDKAKVSLVAENLVRYRNIHDKSRKYYPEEIKIFIAHAQMLLKHQSLLTEIAKASITERLGSYYYDLGDYNKAKPIIEQALSIYEKQLGKKTVMVARTLITIGKIYSDMGNYEAAEKLFNKSYLIYKNQYGNDNPKTARAKFYLAMVHRHLGHYSQALQEYEKVLQIYKKNYRDDHIKIARTMINLGFIYKHIGSFQESITVLEQALTIFKNHYGDNHIKVAHLLVALSDSYRNVKLYKNAKALIEEGFFIYKQHYSNDHIRIAWASLMLSSLYKDLGDYNKAIEIIENNLIIYKKHYGSNHYKIAKIIRNLGAVFLSSGDLKRAEMLFNESLTISKSINHSDQFKSLESLAEVNIIKIQNSENSEQKSLYKSKAFDYLTQALELSKQSLPANSPDIEKITSKLSQFVD